MPEEVIQHLDKRKPAKCVTVTERISECMARPFSLRIHGGQHKFLSIEQAFHLEACLEGRREGKEEERDPGEADAPEIILTLTTEQWFTQCSQ